MARRWTSRATSISPNARPPRGDVANLATLIQAQTTGTDQLTETLLSTSGVTNDLLARIQSDIARLNASMTAVMSRMAA